MGNLLRVGRGETERGEDCRGEVVGVAIDPKVIDPADPETLQDLIVGALADASKQVTILAQTRLGPLAGGLGGFGIPGT